MHRLSHLPNQAHPFWWGLIVFHLALFAPYRLNLRGLIA
jgi:hypothetical protein